MNIKQNYLKLLMGVMLTEEEVESLVENIPYHFWKLSLGEVLKVVGVGAA